MSSEGPLRAMTYLAPGIPLAFFEQVTRYLGAAVGREVVLESDERISGPMHGDPDPFSTGRADMGFLCSPSYLYLRAQAQPSVELLPVGFVFRDARNQGSPSYFSDVIVRKERGISHLEELKSGVFGFNDSCSLSGYFAVRKELAERGLTNGFFRAETCTGSHADSIRAVLSGEIDVAAIDSNALALAQLDFEALDQRIAVIESFGPHPIQPIVLSTRLACELGEPLRQALLAMMEDREVAAALNRFGLESCVPIDDSLYAEERAALEELGQLGSCC